VAREIVDSIIYFPGLRLLTSVSLISVIITIIVSGGICHAVNLLDGLNGLSICWAICAAIAMAVMALSVNDMAVFRLLILLIGASIGILVWNFPLGKIFLGDAGAYTLGHVLAWMALLLMNRHPEISPLALLLIFVWPITDMLLSMLRRKKSGRPIGQPDRLHFHQMVMRVLEIKFFTRARRNLTNPLGTLIILPMATVPMVVAIEFKTQTGPAFIAFCGFVALFVVTYSWALRRAGQCVHRKSPKLNQP
jgi:UDP-GlcNAc:undecaprenyl-phosphate GlcNAc-1-phosphate transferase